MVEYGEISICSKDSNWPKIGFYSWSILASYLSVLSSFKPLYTYFLILKTNSCFAPVLLKFHFFFFFQISAKESPDTQTFTCSTQNEGDDQIGTFSWLLDGVEADTATQGKYTETCQVLLMFQLDFDQVLVGIFNPF